MPWPRDSCASNQRLSPYAEGWANPDRRPKKEPAEPLIGPTGLKVEALIDRRPRREIRKDRFTLRFYARRKSRFNCRTISLRPILVS